MNVKYTVGDVKCVRLGQAHPPLPAAGRNEQRVLAAHLGSLWVLGKIRSDSVQVSVEMISL